MRVLAFYIGLDLFIGFLRLSSPGYRNAALAVLAVLAAALFFNWKKAERALRERYKKIGIVLEEEENGLFFDLIWAGAEVYSLVALGLLPGLFGVLELSAEVDLGLPFARILCLAVLMITTRADLLLTGETVPPAWPLRVVPVSFFTVLVFLSLSMLGKMDWVGEKTVLALYALFLAEVFVNFLARSAVGEKKEIL